VLSALERSYPAEKGEPRDGMAELPLSLFTWRTESLSLQYLSTGVEEGAGETVLCFFTPVLPNPPSPLSVSDNS